MDANVNVLTTYAFFRAVPEGGYDVTFPDFPGCFTYGETFEIAQKNADDVLKLWVAELKDKNEFIKATSSLSTIQPMLIQVS